MDLDLSSAGEAVAPIITCTIEGILEPEDLAALIDGGFDAEDIRTASTPVDDPADLKKLRERHHSVARLIAGGMKPGLVATITGYTPQYISVLQNNPAMEELIELYRIQNGSAAQVITEKLRTVGTKALEKLDERLDGDAKLEVHELVAISKLGLDRADHGPTSKTHHTNEQHVIDHAKLAQLNADARRGSASQIRPIGEARKAAVIEHQPTPLADDQGKLL